jgi:hypothetical protein
VGIDLIASFDDYSIDGPREILAQLQVEHQQIAPE